MWQFLEQGPELYVLARNRQLFADLILDAHWLLIRPV